LAIATSARQLGMGLTLAVVAAANVKA